jgi:hypothetical protein
MAGKYFHIGFNWVGIPKLKELEPVIGVYAVDWIRYGAAGWIVYTYYEMQNLTAALQPLLGPNDHMLIFEIVTPAVSNGWMPKWVWDWLTKFRF